MRDQRIGGGEGYDRGKEELLFTKGACMGVDRGTWERKGPDRGCDLQVAGCRLQVTGYRLQVKSSSSS